MKAEPSRPYTGIGESAITCDAILDILLYIFGYIYIYIYIYSVQYRCTSRYLKYLKVKAVTVRYKLLKAMHHLANVVVTSHSLPIHKASYCHIVGELALHTQ